MKINLSFYLFSERFFSITSYFINSKEFPFLFISKLIKLWRSSRESSPFITNLKLLFLKFFDFIAELILITISFFWVLTKTNFSKLLEELDLKDNYFSVRGELVFVNTLKKEIVIKICPTIKSKNLKNKNFKLVIKGELSLELLHSFVSLDINRDGNSLELINYEVIEKNLSEKN